MNRDEIDHLFEISPNKRDKQVFAHQCAIEGLYEVEFGTYDEWKDTQIELEYYKLFIE